MVPIQDGNVQEKTLQRKNEKTSRNLPLKLWSWAQGVKRACSSYSGLVLHWRKFSVNEAFSSTIHCSPGKMWCLVVLAPWQKYDFGVDFWQINPPAFLGSLLSHTWHSLCRAEAVRAPKLGKSLGKSPPQPQNPLWTLTDFVLDSLLWWIRFEIGQEV